MATLGLIYEAIYRNDLEELKELLQAEGGRLRQQLQAAAACDPTPRPYVCSVYRRSPLHLTIGCFDSLDVPAFVKVLVAEGDDVNCVGEVAVDTLALVDLDLWAEQVNYDTIFADCVLPMQVMCSVELTPLAQAISLGAPTEVLECLIQHGANIRHDGNCSLVVAAVLTAWKGYPRYWNWESLKRNISWALGHGATVDIPDTLETMPIVRLTFSFLCIMMIWEGRIALNPCMEHMVELLRILIQNGADISAVEPLTGNTILHITLLLRMKNRGSSSVLLKFILDHCPPHVLSQRNHAGFDPFACAMHHSTYSRLESATLRVLLQHGGVDPTEYRDECGNTALHVVIKQWPWDLGKKQSGRHLPVIQLLLDRGLDVNAKNKDGQTPLMLAPLYADLLDNVIRCLLRHGADCNIKDNRGRTAMHMAASFGELSRLQLLVEYGADLNKAIDVDGNTLLHCATSDIPFFTRGHPRRLAVIRYLVDSGVDSAGLTLNSSFETPLSKTTNLHQIYTIVRFGMVNSIVQQVLPML